jgi:hypothetical protein
MAEVWLTKALKAGAPGKLAVSIRFAAGDRSNLQKLLGMKLRVKTEQHWLEVALREQTSLEYKLIVERLLGAGWQVHEVDLDRRRMSTP